MVARALMILWILLSPEAMSALSQITESQILSGCMELESGMTGMIYAEGRKEGQIWDITAKWKDGLPQWVRFDKPRSEL